MATPAETAPVYDLSSTHRDDTFNINSILEAGYEHDIVTDTCSLKFAKDIITPMLSGASGAFALDAAAAAPTYEIVAGAKLPELVIKGVKLKVDLSLLPTDILHHPVVNGLTAITGGTPFKGTLELNEVRMANVDLGSDRLGWTGEAKLRALNEDGKPNPFLTLAIKKGLPTLINPQKQLEENLFIPVVNSYDELYGNGDGSHAKTFVGAGVQLVAGLTPDTGKFKIRLKTKSVGTAPPPAVTTPLPVLPT